jgi:uncharacterized membrane protein
VSARPRDLPRARTDFRRWRPIDTTRVRGTSILGGVEEPPHTIYHRWLGWHAPAIRRVMVGIAFGVIVGVILAPFVRWPLAMIGAWDAAAAAFVVAVWVVIWQADGPHTKHIAMREDETRNSARLLLFVASIASIFAIGFPLSFAGGQSNAGKVVLIAVSISTIALSWLVVNTLFTLRYADLYFRMGTSAIDFGETDLPCYRDFAYLAFTIGMTYQVSDTTLRDETIRRTVLFHALLSYVFGVVIVAASINLIAGIVA